MNDSRVLLLAPTRRDRAATLELLQRARIAATPFAGAKSLAVAIEASVGAIVMTDAAFLDPHFDQLLHALSRQPAWSDIPIVLLCRIGAPPPGAARPLESLSNVTLLERPTSSRTLLSSIEAALRARARQYQLRDQFDALRASEAAVRESERQFRTMVNSIPQLAWMADADGNVHWYNRRWYDYTGTTPEEMVGAGWQSVHDPAILPEVLSRWRTSIASGLPFEMEFPLRSAGGRFRTFLTRVVPLKGEQGQVVQWFGTNTDLEETKQIEMQLRATESALRDADHRKDLFLATLAHELRNPLAPIRTAAEILGSPRVGPQQLQWARHVVRRQVGHMALLLDDLLDIARITQGKLELKKSLVSLTSVVEAAVEAARPVLDGKRHHFTVSLPDGNLTFEADPLRVAQVLSNLLTNAGKYTDPGGHIALTGSVDGDMLRLSVVDDGIGIEAGALTHIFEMFSQGQGTASRSDGGLGIGLSLVKGLLELHGGSIEARSNGPGCGSEFVVFLPLHAGGAAEAVTGATETPGGPERGRRVLIADDNRDAADALGMLLELAGHDVRVTYGGHAALDLAQSFRPDVAFIDIGMPDLAGYDVAMALRREPWGRTIHLVALTGWAQDADRQRARRAGFDRHMTKPIDMGTLERILSESTSLESPPAVGRPRPRAQSKPGSQNL